MTLRISKCSHTEHLLTHLLLVDFPLHVCRFLCLRPGDVSGSFSSSLSSLSGLLGIRIYMRISVKLLCDQVYCSMCSRSPTELNFTHPSDVSTSNLHLKKHVIKSSILRQWILYRDNNNDLIDLIFYVVFGFVFKKKNGLGMKIEIKTDSHSCHFNRNICTQHNA